MSACSCAYLCMRACVYRLCVSCVYIACVYRLCALFKVQSNMLPYLPMPISTKTYDATRKKTTKTKKQHTIARLVLPIAFGQFLLLYLNTNKQPCHFIILICLCLCLLCLLICVNRFPLCLFFSSFLPYSPLHNARYSIINPNCPPASLVASPVMLPLRCCSPCCTLLYTAYYCALQIL